MLFNITIKKKKKHCIFNILYVNNNHLFIINIFYIYLNFFTI